MVLKNTRNWPALWLALWLGMMAITAEAETVYVSDQLVIGMHEDKTRESTILRLLTTGTALELVKREGEFAQVTTEDGANGWVDANYLALEKPASVVVDELEDWKASRKEELAAAWREVESLRQQLDEARENKPDEKPKTDTPNPALKALQQVQNENRRLKEDLTEAQAALDQEPKPRTVGDSSHPDADSTFPLIQGTFLARAMELATEAWHWASMGVLFLLGLLLGAYITDAKQRRKHDGYRF